MKKVIQMVILLIGIAILGGLLTWLLPEKNYGNLDAKFQEALNGEAFNEEMLAELTKIKVLLTKKATIKTNEKDKKWLLEDPNQNKIFLVVKKGEKLQITEEGLDFTPLIPPILAIGIALITKEVLSALFVGIYSGVVLLLFGQATTDPSLTFFQKLTAGVLSAFEGFFRVIDKYALEALIDKDHATVIIFSLTIGGMVGVVTVSGGLQGIVARLSTIAKDSVRGQFATFLMGVFIFFDDYANCLIVGNTTRPLTDKLRISREKLSFLVDSTSAPVASIAIISTWIGYEVGLIGDQLQVLGLENIDSYTAFLQSLPYRFYAFFMLIFILMVIFFRRDFGPMYRAEMRARKTGETLRKDSVLVASEEKMEQALPTGVPPRWYNAVIPIVLLILSVIGGMIYTGHTSAKETLDGKKAEIAKIEKALKEKAGELKAEEKAAQEATKLKLKKEVTKLESSWAKAIINNCNSYKSLLWASLLSTMIAILIVIFQRIVPFQETMKAWTNGVSAMIPAIIILVLAWSLGSIISDLDTKSELAKLVGDRVVSEQYRNHLIHLLPTITFFIAALTALATGSSWGTMGILFPIVMPLTVTLTTGNEFQPLQLQFLYMTIGAILTGSIFGDHCSPISDTTILSSMASGVDHMDHVHTQMPYAFTVGFVSIFCGYLPAGYGWPGGYQYSPYICTGVGTIVMLIVLFVIGKKVPSIEAKVETEFATPEDDDDLVAVEDDDDLVAVEDDDEDDLAMVEDIDID